MKKKLVYLLLLLPFSLIAQPAKKIDSVALLILDHMSDVIGDLNSCSFKLSTSNDVVNAEYGASEKQFAEHEVYMQGPDKMLVQTRGAKHHKGFWYNGSHLTYYSYTENNYAVIDAPSHIIAAIDSINENYEIEFPAADFFYPSFTDDLIENSNTIVFLGSEKIDGKDCFHILAEGADMNIQIWVSNDALNLPVKLVITDKKKPLSPQYQASFSKWQLNPVLPASIFEFVAPPGAREIAILPKKK